MNRRPPFGNTPYERLLSALHAGSQTVAASLLGVRPAILSDCKRRGMIVTRELLEKARAQGINPAWVQSGLGSVYLC